MDEKPKKLSTDSYKGVRDFFPEEMATLKKIFEIWRNSVEKYGYEEYSASVLEPAELYRNKTSEELVNEQTYTFTDRGEREVTLRPEMTPTVARMVSSKRRDLVFPLRWYSIPNLFRYEQPQRGRVREHWQLNVDVFGIENINAEIEIINIAYDIMRAYGLKDTDFEIRLNSRKIMNYISREILALNEEEAAKLSRLIDRKEKMDSEAFEKSAATIINDDSDLKKLMTILNSKNFEEFTSSLPQSAASHEGFKEVREVILGLENLGITNVRFDQTLMRGFDYYTGIVFEIFDLNPNNRRSIFGGGRYDDLLSIFGGEKISAVGFGAGDVVARDLMETYENLPTVEPPANISICIVGDANTPYALELAQLLRSQGIKTSVDLSGKKLGDQIANADKRKIPRIICVGDTEVKTGKLRVKTLSTGEEITITESDIASIQN